MSSPFNEDVTLWSAPCSGSSVVFRSVTLDTTSPPKGDQPELLLQMPSWSGSCCEDGNSQQLGYTSVIHSLPYISNLIFCVPLVLPQSPACLCIHLSVCLSIYRSVYVCIYLSIDRSIYLSIYPSICAISIYLWGLVLSEHVLHLLMSS